MKKLTIAIPTWNRASRLNIFLKQLLDYIESSKFTSEVEVLVSDNASTDDTRTIILSHQSLYLEKKVAFVHLENHTADSLFDENIRRCYQGSSGQYVWFSSDDDNLYPEAISTIMETIFHENSGAFYFNFKQPPYSEENPRVKRNSRYEFINKECVDELYEIVSYPKLTSMVIRNGVKSSQPKVKNLGFYHLELFIRAAHQFGGFVKSKQFVAYTDDDFMDQIRYVPYVGNSLNEQLGEFLPEINLMDYYQSLSVPHTCPLSSSLNMLGASYRNKIEVPDFIRTELWSTISKEFRWENISVASVIEIFKFVLSFSVLRRQWRVD